MTLIDAFPNWLISGIFNKIDEVPWDNSISSQLDREYFGNHSGSKTISPLVRRMLNPDGELTEIAIGLIGEIISVKFSVNWQMLWKSLQVAEAYVPYDNYNMIENVDKKVNNNETSTANDVITHGKTVDTDYFHYGFNSTEKQPSDSESVKDGGTTTTARNSSDNGVIAELSTTKRHGNIGVTTSQQMIESEIELRKKNFFDIVFSDVDSILALKIYDTCKGG